MAHLGQLFKRSSTVVERSWPIWPESLSYDGMLYQLFSSSSSWQRTTAPSYTLSEAYRSNGVVFGLTTRRIALMSQCRFAFRRLDSRRSGRPTVADLEWTDALDPLADPKGLLRDMENDVGDHGNAFVVDRGGGDLTTLNPEWVTLVHGSNLSIDADPEALHSTSRPVGIIYDPPGTRDPAELFPVGRYGHYKPYNDPDYRGRGMSWREPVLHEIGVAAQSRTYVRKFYENSATPNMMITFDPNVTPEKVKKFRELFAEQHEGVDAAFKTITLGGGAKPTVVGSKLADLDQESITRLLHAEIAIASGVPAIVAGVLPGLDSSTLANYHQANRQFGDTTLRDLWGEAARAFAPLIDVPDGFELWPDTRTVAALQDDAKDDADTMAVQAATINTLITAGFEPDAAAEAVTTGNLDAVIGEHTGRTSVQLQPMDEDQPEPENDEIEQEEEGQDEDADDDDDD